MSDDMFQDEGGERLHRVPDETRCLDCAARPDVRVTFSVETGPTTVVFCRDHAKAWWDRFKHTAAGQSAKFGAVLPSVARNTVTGETVQPGEVPR